VHEREREIVEAGYDAIARGYLKSKDPQDPFILSRLTDLSDRLPTGSQVLDLGCGAGIPATQFLAQRFKVTGVDVSQTQIDLVRERVPAGHFVKADMRTVERPPATFAAVVSLYAIIHIPREEHLAVLHRIHRWLIPGGLFLATWATGDWEGEDPNWEGWGAPMWWSHFGSETNLRLLAEAGFSVLDARIDDSHGESWLWVLAQRD